MKTRICRKKINNNFIKVFPYLYVALPISTKGHYEIIKLQDSQLDKIFIKKPLTAVLFPSFSK